MGIRTPHPARLKPNRSKVGKIRNPNIEIRNKFEIQMFKNSKQKTFEFGRFGFVSNFGFRASNFESTLSIKSFVAILRTT